MHSSSQRLLADDARRCRDPQKDSIWRERFVILGLHWFSAPNYQWMCEKEEQKLLVIRGDGGHQKNMTHWISKEELTWSLEDWSSKHRAFMDLHQVLWVCYSFHFGGFVGQLLEQDYLSFFCLFLPLFSCYWISFPASLWGLLNLLILSSFILVDCFPLEASCSSKEETEM